MTSGWIRPLLLGGLLALSGAADSALACASCGSGGDDPLILYPNERNKIYFGVGRATRFQNVDSDGQLSSAGGPDAKETMTLAYGHGFSPRSFATITLPFGRNVRDHTTRSSLGDPSLAGRYTLVMQSIAEPLIPQVQLVGSYKHAQATSIHDSTERTLMDVFGTGFSEVKAGIDVWYGQSDLKIGAAHTVIAPLEKVFQERKYQPGVGHRSTASIGYGLPSARATIGANHDRRAGLGIDGREQPNADQVNNVAFVTVDVMVAPSDSVRLSFARQAAFGRNKNTARADALSVAYMKAL